MPMGELGSALGGWGGGASPQWGVNPIGNTRAIQYPYHLHCVFVAVLCIKSFLVFA